MSKTLVGIVAYGGLRFLEMGLNALREQKGFDVLVIIAKPGDTEMWDWFVTRPRQEPRQFITAKIHELNKGFAGAINDLYDHAFTDGDYDNLIIMGNDVVPMPGAIEAMIHCADTTDYEMVCGSEFNAKFLCDHYPEARKFFHGPNLIFQDWGARPWLLHKDTQTGVEPDTRKDIRNLTLFKRSSFEKVGYDDVNFWPNGYFADNDYGRRCDLLGVRACGLKEAAFFHFTSRTIHQSVSREHHVYFDRNRVYYTHKWHGEPGHEKLCTPFGGGPYILLPDVKNYKHLSVPCDMKISTRDHEAACIEYWASR
jgi:GT2 family glycosyltransferase